MSGNKFDRDNRILVEFHTSGGEQPVGFWDRAKLEEKSEEAIEKAMATIHNMAQRVITTVNDIKNRPSSVEVSFGIKFDGKVDVIIAKAGAEASIEVTIKWDSNA
ncbi:MAG TPA: CU044_2847 family protein [Nitrososphaeraceae archaeon]|nr:CU044_2847 family protein [Nitrososphaeraceae archaeon]